MRDEEEARESAKYVGKKHGDLKREDRDFPYRSKGGTWVHPKTGDFISPAQAKRIIRSTERRIIVRNIARETGRSEADVRKRLKGVSTNDLVGRHLYSKKDPKTGKIEQTRGTYKVTKKRDTRKTITKKDTRKTIIKNGKRVPNPNQGGTRRVKNPDYGKVKRTRKLVKGPTTKGKKALRKLGIVATGPGSLLRY